MALEPLGLKRFDSLHFYVRDLDRTRRLFTETLDFAELGESDDELTARGHQKSVVFQAGDARVIVSAPVGEGGRAWRWLRKHPEGVGTLAFEVADVDKVWHLLEQRGGTPIDEIQRFDDGRGGKLSTFSITTAFGDTTIRFFQRDAYAQLYPGIAAYSAPRGGQNKFGFKSFDHVTSNFETMKPALLWMEHVLGFERYWDVEFHTVDVAPDKSTGSGLKSIVMWDPTSGLRFANNEPRRPYFKRSQINVFAEEHRGDGIQHAALTVDNIEACVRGLRARAVPFMPTPGTYYDMLPDRVKQLGIEKIDEDIAMLRELEILVDGGGKNAYMLQIFLQEMSRIHGDTDAGPFFFEIIQRKGDRGFGAGNFRALFESIEREQTAAGRV